MAFSATSIMMVPLYILLMFVAEEFHFYIQPDYVWWIGTICIAGGATLQVVPRPLHPYPRSGTAVPWES
jgi:hypothetical protein